MQQNQVVHEGLVAPPEKMEVVQCEGEDKGVRQEEERSQDWATVTAG